MGTQFFKQANGLLVVVLLALVLVLGDRVTTGRAAPNAVMQPVLVPQVFNVNCTSLAAITPTYAKLLDMATFAVQSPDSIVEVTVNGRIFVGSFSAGTGALFELRVDDQPSTTGRARANMRTAEAGGGGVQASITGFFSGLEPGNHTASMWVRSSNSGAGNQAMVDPGCWSSDVLIVKEHLPMGFTYLPAVIGE